MLVVQDALLISHHKTPTGLFLLYWSKTTASTSIKNMLYADNVTLVAESKEEL